MEVRKLKRTVIVLASLALRLNVVLMSVEILAICVSIAAVALMQISYLNLVLMCFYLP